MEIKNGKLSQNSASTYFSVFKAALKQAFIDGYFTTDIAAKIKKEFQVKNQEENI